MLTWHWGVHEEVNWDCDKRCEAIVCPPGGQVSGKAENGSYVSHNLQGTNVVLAFLTDLCIGESSKHA